MVNWQITATTIYCEAVSDEVTIMVHKDWSVTCTAHRSGRKGCQSLECPQSAAYVQKLKSEEAKAEKK